MEILESTLGCWLGCKDTGAGSTGFRGALAPLDITEEGAQGGTFALERGIYPKTKVQGENSYSYQQNISVASKNFWHACPLSSKHSSVTYERARREDARHVPIRAVLFHPLRQYARGSPVKPLHEAISLRVVSCSVQLLHT